MQLMLEHGFKLSVVVYSLLLLPLYLEPLFLGTCVVV